MQEKHCEKFQMSTVERWHLGRSCHKKWRYSKFKIEDKLAGEEIMEEEEEEKYLGDIVSNDGRKIKWI